METCLRGAKPEVAAQEATPRASFAGAVRVCPPWIPGEGAYD